MAIRTGGATRNETPEVLRVAAMKLTDRHSSDVGVKPDVE